MSDAPAYQVLARKYRPETFADLVGQDAMVRTLQNAFRSGRIAQAFLMTGIRGTGKTTTARIIAKGMNCIGPDGTGGPTTEPCGTCEHCRAIIEGRHVDVLEMDAASHTGVANIREIIDGVQYRAASARYKVYIIDEVHMLSTGAFNALLKTLEEPPAHVKFVFATTEVRKVPVTVLSRCQRFDLRRIEPEAMIALLRRIAGAEGATIPDEALALIARAAEGSARDATSLLDQAISHGQGETTAEGVRAMLGLADRGRILDLFEMILRGDAAGALAELGAQYSDGADPLAVLRDLAEVAHWISVVKITPEAAEDPTVPPQERGRGRDLAAQLSIRVLTRAWQMLLKALEEVARAPSAMMAAEMAVIRLTHVAEMPTPDDLVRQLEASGGPGGPPGSRPTGGRPAGEAERAGAGPSTIAAAPPGPAGARASSGAGHEPPGPSLHARGTSGDADRAASGPDGSTPADAAAPAARSAASDRAVSPDGAPYPGGGLQTDLAPPRPPSGPTSRPASATAAAFALDPGALARFATFDDVLTLIRANRDALLQVEIERHLRLVRYAPGRIEFQPTDDAPRDLASRLGARLQAWTGNRWAVSVVAAGGAETIHERRTAAERDLALRAEEHPLVRAVLDAFPSARIAAIRTVEAQAGAAVEEALPAVEDEWDPFEED